MGGNRFDMIVANGIVVTADSNQRFDIGVRNGKIAALEAGLGNNAEIVIDAFGRLVFPGFIDAHTHMGIPIKNTTSADDFASGSVAAACGGVTTILDFTVQDKGQSINEALQIRQQKASGKSHVDYGIHVNITDQPENNLGQIRALTERGFTSFKVFSTYRQAGMMADWQQFRAIMREVNACRGLVMLHAEDNDMVERMTEANIAAGKTDALYHAHSRTDDAEARAIATACAIAGELGAPLYIVHVSSKKGLTAALKARQQGARIYIETCPHYLLLTSKQYQKKTGHYYIATPPLRGKQDNEALWKALSKGEVDVVATDHCPFTKAQKDSGGGLFHTTPNGMAGVETLFPLLYTYGVARERITPQQLVQVLAKNPAAIFGLSNKGDIRLGADADLVVWNPLGETVVQAADMHGNADWSPYEEMSVTGKLDYTILRGQILVQDGQFKGDKVLGQPA